MPVQLIKPGTVKSFPLTSPPKDGWVNAGLWKASAINFTDRKIIITHPFPDMIDVIAPISEHTQCFPDHSSKTALQKAKQLDQEVKSHLKAFPAIDGLSLSRVWPPHDPRKASIHLTDKHQNLGYVELWRSEKEGFPSWDVRLEFNPRRLGHTGLAKLRARFDEALGFVSLGAVLREGKLSRLDVAIDVLGVLPLDLIVRVADNGKVQQYRSQSGALETTLYFGKKSSAAKPYKTLGPLRLKVYDKKAEAKDKGQPQLYESERITRLEVSRKWKSYRPNFAGILSVANPLKGIEVAYSSPDDLVSKGLWRTICEQALVHGIDNVTASHPVSQSLKLISAYKTIEPDILAQNSWSSWHKGVSLTGLKKWATEIWKDDFPSLPHFFE